MILNTELILDIDCVHNAETIVKHSFDTKTKISYIHLINGNEKLSFSGIQLGMEMVFSDSTISSWSSRNILEVNQMLRITVFNLHDVDMQAKILIVYDEVE